MCLPLQQASLCPSHRWLKDAHTSFCFNNAETDLWGVRLHIWSYHCEFIDKISCQLNHFQLLLPGFLSFLWFWMKTKGFLIGLLVLLKHINCFNKQLFMFFGCVSYFQLVKRNAEGKKVLEFSWWVLFWMEEKWKEAVFKPSTVSNIRPFWELWIILDFPFSPTTTFSRQIWISFVESIGLRASPFHMIVYHMLSLCW